MTAARVKLDIDGTRDTLGALGLSYAAEALDALLARYGQKLVTLDQAAA